MEHCAAGRDVVSARTKAGQQRWRLRVTEALLLCLTLLLCNGAWAQTTPSIPLKIAYLHGPREKIRLSLLDIPAADDGLAGLTLAINDANDSAGFTGGPTFTVVDMPISGPEAVTKALNDVVNNVGNAGVMAVVADLDAASLLALADALKPLPVFNASARDERLRESDCRANVFHIAPSWAQLADGLAQFSTVRQWRRWVLIRGSHPADQQFADALRRAAQRFAVKIVGEREFADRGGARRSDSGIVEIQRQMTELTQELPDYDLLVVADDSEVFGGYLPYRTWQPRPVAGSAGLVPTSWDGAFDQWGAVQLQNRFIRLAHRPMSAKDMQAWTAGGVIAQGIARRASPDAAGLRTALLSPQFAIAAFKGQPLTFRDWNQQLRQPILLFDGRNSVSVSPQEGFLHEVSELDTLGVDRPETHCHF